MPIIFPATIGKETVAVVVPVTVGSSTLAAVIV